MAEQPEDRSGGTAALAPYRWPLKRRAMGAVATVGALLFAIALPASAATSAPVKPASAGAATVPSGAAENEYRQTNLLSDIPGVARNTDPNLVNPWGMAAGPATPIWVSDNGSDVTTLYRGAIGGTALLPVPLVVGIPTGAPTGQVFNDAKNFDISSGKFHGPPLFIFATENGSITGWNPGVPAPAPSVWAQVGVTVPNAVYKGLAITTDPSGDFLYAANFHAGTIDVFNGKYKLVHWGGAFHDASIRAVNDTDRRAARRPVALRSEPHRLPPLLRDRTGRSAGVPEPGRPPVMPAAFAAFGGRVLARRGQGTTR
jgi:hypothetical protein